LAKNLPGVFFSKKMKGIVTSNASQSRNQQRKAIGKVVVGLAREGSRHESLILVGMDSGDSGCVSEIFSAVELDFLPTGYF